MSSVSIILLCALLALLLVGVFVFQHRNIKKLQQIQINHLETEITKNKKEIQTRTNCLNRYSFLQYNLEEALIVQKNIALNL